MHVSRLTPVHADAYRTIMLGAYASEPDAFTATVSEREPLPLEWWASRISKKPGADELVFGAFGDAGLVGVAGLRFACRARTRHKSTLFGTFVLPDFRGREIGRSLVEAVLAHARATPGTLVVQLTATETNTAAIRLYESCGFVPFGTEPFAIRDGERFASLVHMWCPVSPDAA